MAPRSKQPTESTKFERPPEFQMLLYSDILQSQQTGTNAAGELADTELICNGGCIRVHGFLLQGASPLFQKAMASQGENYPHMRKILLPDFHVKIIERMLSLIYKGYVDISTDPDVESLKEVLKFFQVSSVDFNLDEDEDCKILTGDLKIQELNRIPQDIFKMNQNHQRSPVKSKVEVKPMVEVIIKADKRKITKKEEEEPVPGPSSQTPLRRSRRPQKPVLRFKTVKNDAEKSDDSDFKGNVSAVSSSDEEPSDSDSQPKRKRGRRPGTQVVKPSSKACTASETTPAPDERKTGNIAAKISNNEDKKGKDDEKDKADEDPETDSEDEDWVKPNFKDKEWFLREAKLCQGCKKTYDLPSDAANCIQSHKKTLRCYFCFKVYSSTGILFRHFRRRHKQAAKENTLICPYCGDQAVPYRSVSCHVISVHLSKKVLEENNRSSSESPASTPSKVSKPQPSGSRRRSRSRSNSFERRSSSERHPQKKLRHAKKKEEGMGRKLQAGNLDVTLEKKTSLGTTIRFRIQKARHMLALPLAAD